MPGLDQGVVDGHRRHARHVVFRRTAAEEQEDATHGQRIPL
jgi:hypothetical protein